MNRIFLTLGILLTTSSIASRADEPPAAVRELIAKHCVDCHGPTVQKAKLRLDRGAVMLTKDQKYDSPQSGVGLCILKLASTPKSQTLTKTARLAARVNDEVKPDSNRAQYLALIEYIVASKYPYLSREEIRAMLNLDDYKKSRVYKETRQEVLEERDAEWIKNLCEQGIAADKIAQAMNLELDVVKKALRKKPGHKK